MFLISRSLRQLLIEERSRADVLQADGIQHAGGSLPQARRRIADHRLHEERPLTTKPPSLIEVDYVFELDSVAEGAAGRDDGILEVNAGEGHAEIQWRFAAFSEEESLRLHGDLAAFPGASASASVSTRPTAWVGALIPSSDANVTAMSTGSACVR